MHVSFRLYSSADMQQLGTPAHPTPATLLGLEKTVNVKQLCRFHCHAVLTGHDARGCETY